MRIYVDATTLIGLGDIGRSRLLTNFDGEPIVLPAVREEVTTEPARANLDGILDTSAVHAAARPDCAFVDSARSILEESGTNGDIQLVAATLARRDADAPVAIVSDDRWIRTVTRGLGARVTGTIGVIVRAVEEGMPAEEGKAIVRRLDEQGLHMTGELRETADELIDDAAG